MFAGCTNLKEIKGVIDMSKVTVYKDMFKNCPNLKGVKFRFTTVPKNFDETALGLTDAQLATCEVVQ